MKAILVLFILLFSVSSMAFPMICSKTESVHTYQIDIEKGEISILDKDSKLIQFIDLLLVKKEKVVAYPPIEETYLMAPNGGDVIAVITESSGKLTADVFDVKGLFCKYLN